MCSISKTVFTVVNRLWVEKRNYNRGVGIKPEKHINRGKLKVYMNTQSYTLKCLPKKCEQF